MSSLLGAVSANLAALWDESNADRPAERAAALFRIKAMLMKEMWEAEGGALGRRGRLSFSDGWTELDNYEDLDALMESIDEQLVVTTRDYAKYDDGILKKMEVAPEVFSDASGTLTVDAVLAMERVQEQISRNQEVLSRNPLTRKSPPMELAERAPPPPPQRSRSSSVPKRRSYKRQVVYGKNDAPKRGWDDDDLPLARRRRNDEEEEEERDPAPDFMSASRKFQADHSAGGWWGCGDCSCS